MINKLQAIIKKGEGLRIEFKNANKPHQWGALKPGNFEPFPKNPHIAQIFTQMGRSKELGTGVKNVFRYNKIYSNVENNDFIENDIFITTVPLKIFKELNEPVNEPVNERQKNILELILNNKNITIVELKSRLKAGRETIKRDLQFLQEHYFIKRIGSKKTGYWEVNKNNK